MLAKFNPWRTSDRQVIFLLEERFKGVYDFPVPARNFIPESYRKIGNNASEGWPPQPTVRSCMPFFDAMTLGFLIPTPFDLYLASGDSGRSVEIVPPNINGLDYGLDSEAVVHHVPREVVGGGDRPTFKLETPYWIRTGRGFSSVLTGLLNRESGFSVASGMPDTDRFYTKIKIFFSWTGPDGRHFIPAGTPIAQVFPVKRSSFKSENLFVGKEEIVRMSADFNRSRIENKWYKKRARASRND